MDKNMNNPKISVLMPVYNAEKFLNESIDSILNQTYKDFEFLIINDASTDNSKEIILSYKDPRIRYFENKKNLGVAKTLNRGLRLAKGKYVARMDADDIASLQRLQLQHEILNQQENKLAVVASYYDIIDENGNHLYAQKNASTPEEIYYTLYFNNCLGHPTVMINKKIIKAFNGYNEQQEAEDYDLWLRLSTRYKFFKIKKRLLKLRIHPKSRIGSLGSYINRSAFLLAYNNLSSMINQPINIKTAKILTNYQEGKPSSAEIKQAILILQRINKQVVKSCPKFLNQSKVVKFALKKERYLKIKHIFRGYLALFFFFINQFVKK